MKEYYFSNGDEKFGPFSLDQLKRQNVSRDSLVWCEGMADWTRASEIKELSSMFIDLSKKEAVHEVEIIETTSENSSSRMFQSPFSFKGRIRRTEYGISLIIYYALYGVLVAMMDGSDLAALAIIPLLWFFLAQGAKRCHDRGNSGWYQIIPFYFLWLLFGEGDKGPNEYGADPKS